MAAAADALGAAEAPELAGAEAAAVGALDALGDGVALFEHAPTMIATAAVRAAALLSVLGIDSASSELSPLWG